jgi:broad specificity phosphatase PhoE
LSYVYLVRHGQAGTRDDYDSLSTLGREQARRLGDYFAREGLTFGAALSGSMKRQSETANEVRCAYLRAGLAFPEVETREEWNEFDLDHLYRNVAPRLCQDDPSFRAGYERMKDEMLASGGDPSAAVHRRWTRADSTLFEAWVSGRYEGSGESWNAFCERIRGCQVDMGGTGNLAVFTSATPTAIWAGVGLDVLDERVMRVADVLYNASYTVLRVRSGQVRLFSLNNIPHLPDSSLRTRR